MNNFQEVTSVIGNQFVCRNRKCKLCGSGFSMYGSWPISFIDLVINSKAINSKPDHKDHLIKCKNEGRKYAIITLPNNENIPTVGERVQLFCQKDGIIWERDLVDGDKVLDKKCDKCKGDLLDYKEVKEIEIACPKCKEKLECTVWFSQYK
jgi:hypothetical protein